MDDLKFVVFVRQGHINLFVSASEIANMTTNDILVHLHFPEDHFLLIHSNNLIRKLNPNEKPLQTFPELIQSQRIRSYQHPEFYIQIENVALPLDSCIIFKLISNAPNNELPNYNFFFNYDEMAKKNFYQFAQDIVSELPYGCTHTTFMMNKIQIPNDSEMSLLLKNVHKNEFSIRLNLTDEYLAKIEKRTKLLRDFIADEAAFILDISHIALFWEPQLVASNLVMKGDMSFVSRCYKSTISSHNLFLQELKKKGAVYSLEIINILCDVKFFFESCVDFFFNYLAIIAFFEWKETQISFQQGVAQISAKPENPSRMSFFEIINLPAKRNEIISKFFNEIKDETPNFHPDYVYINECKEVLDIFSKKTNLLIQSPSEKLRSVCLLQQKIINKTEIISPQRFLETFYKVKLTSPKTREGTFYIFNDIVLLSSVMKKGLKVDYLIDTTEFRYTFSNISISIHKKSKKIYTFSFSSKEEFDNAITFITKAKEKKFIEMGILENIFLFESTDQNTSLPSFSSHESIILNNCLYLIGGHDNHKYSPVAAILSFKDNSFKTLKLSTCGMRKYHTVSVVGSCIYIFGGVDPENRAMNLFNFIDTENNNSISKIRCNNVPPRYGHTMIGMARRLFMFGGYDEKHLVMNECFVFEPHTNNWHPVKASHAPSARAFHSCTVVNKRAVIFGGLDSNSSALNDIYVFDIERVMWSCPTITGDGLAPRFKHKAVTYNDWMIIIGGVNESNQMLPPCAIKFIDNDTVVVHNFITGGNDRPSLENYGVNIYNDEIIISGGFLKDLRSTTNAILKVKLPKIIHDPYEENFAKKYRSQRLPLMNSHNIFIAKGRNSVKLSKNYVNINDNKNDNCGRKRVLLWEANKMLLSTNEASSFMGANYDELINDNAQVDNGPNPFLAQQKLEKPRSKTMKVASKPISVQQMDRKLSQYADTLAFGDNDRQLNSPPSDQCDNNNLEEEDVSSTSVKPVYIQNNGDNYDSDDSDDDEESMLTTTTTTNTNKNNVGDRSTRYEERFDSLMVPISKYLSVRVYDDNDEDDDENDEDNDDNKHNFDSGSTVSIGGSKLPNVPKIQKGPKVPPPLGYSLNNGNVIRLPPALDEADEYNNFDGYGGYDSYNGYDGGDGFGDSIDDVKIPTILARIPFQDEAENTGDDFGYDENGNFGYTDSIGLPPPLMSTSGIKFESISSKVNCDLISEFINKPTYSQESVGSTPTNLPLPPKLTSKTTSTKVELKATTIDDDAKSADEKEIPPLGATIITQLDRTRATMPDPLGSVHESASRFRPPPIGSGVAITPSSAAKMLHNSAHFHDDEIQVDTQDYDMKDENEYKELLGSLYVPISKKSTLENTGSLGKPSIYVPPSSSHDHSTMIDPMLLSNSSSNSNTRIAGDATLGMPSLLRNRSDSPGPSAPPPLASTYVMKEGSSSRRNPMSFFPAPLRSDDTASDDEINADKKNSLIINAEKKDSLIKPILSDMFPPPLYSEKSGSDSSLSKKPSSFDFSDKFSINDDSIINGKDGNIINVEPQLLLDPLKTPIQPPPLGVSLSRKLSDFALPDEIDVKEVNEFNDEEVGVQMPASIKSSSLSKKPSSFSLDMIGDMNPINTEEHNPFCDEYGSDVNIESRGPLPKPLSLNFAGDLGMPTPPLASRHLPLNSMGNSNKDSNNMNMNAFCAPSVLSSSNGFLQPRCIDNKTDFGGNEFAVSTPIPAAYGPQDYPAPVILSPGVVPSPTMSHQRPPLQQQQQQQIPSFLQPSVPPSVEMPHFPTIVPPPPPSSSASSTTTSVTAFELPSCDLIPEPHFPTIVPPPPPLSSSTSLGTGSSPAGGSNPSSSSGIPNINNNSSNSSGIVSVELPKFPTHIPPPPPLAPSVTTAAAASATSLTSSFEGKEKESSGQGLSPISSEVQYHTPQAGTGRGMNIIIPPPSQTPFSSIAPPPPMNAQNRPQTGLAAVRIPNPISAVPKPTTLRPNNNDSNNSQNDSINTAKYASLGIPTPPKNLRLRSPLLNNPASKPK